MYDQQRARRSLHLRAAKIHVIGPESAISSQSPAKVQQKSREVPYTLGFGDI